MVDIPSFVQNFLPSAKKDFVLILDDEYKVILREATVVDVRVKPNARNMEHPLENGSIITDHRILLPVEIDLTIILTNDNYADTYASILQYYLAGTLLVVQTKVSVYENMIMTEIPHSEVSEMLDAIPIVISFKQVQLVTAQYNISPKKQANTNTVQKGTQQGSTANGDEVAKATTGLGGSFP